MNVENPPIHLQYTTQGYLHSYWAAYWETLSDYLNSLGSSETLEPPPLHVTVDSEIWNVYWETLTDFINQIPGVVGTIEPPPIQIKQVRKDGRLSRIWTEYWETTHNFIENI